MICSPLPGVGYLFLLAVGVWTGYCRHPIDIGLLVESLSPGSTVLLEFDFVLVDLDDLYTADNVSFVDELVADYGAGPFVADEDAGYQTYRPCAGA